MGNKISRRRLVVDERYTRPQGLYEHQGVDQKKLRRLILDAKLAPCYPGIEDQVSDLDECPICFLFYPSLNRSKCCLKCICTECFLQMKAPHSARPTQCPFCKMPNYAVEYRGAKTLEEKGIEQAEEQRVIEAKIRIRQRELKGQQDQLPRSEEDIHHGRSNQFSNLCGFTVSSTDTEAGVVPRRGCLRTTARRTGGPLLDTRMESRQSSNTDEAHQQVSNAFTGRGWTLHGPGDSSNLSHSQGAHMSGTSFAEINRDEDFDLNLDETEDIMVMEAIWLSLQEQSPRWQDSPSASQRTMATFGFFDGDVDLESSIHESLLVPAARDVRETRGTSATGGLAGALAALAETQALNVGRAGTVQGRQRNHFLNRMRLGNSVLSINNCRRNAHSSFSMFESLLDSDDTAQVVSAYATPTRPDGSLDKEYVIEEGQIVNSDFENDPDWEEIEQVNWLDSDETASIYNQDANQRLDSCTDVSLERSQVLSSNRNVDVPYYNEPWGPNLIGL